MVPKGISACGPKDKEEEVGPEKSGNKNAEDNSQTLCGNEVVVMDRNRFSESLDIVLLIFVF